MATTPWMSRSGPPQDAALREDVVAALLRLAEATAGSSDYRRRFCELIALHVLVRASRRDPRLRSAPALFSERAFSVSFAAIDRGDDDWMLATADHRLIESSTPEARAEALREFPRLYAQFSACVGELAAVEETPAPRIEGPLRLGYVEGATFPAGDLLSGDEAPQIRVAWPAQTHDAGAAFDADRSVGAPIPAFARLAQSRQWASPAVTYAEFADAWLHAPSGLLFTQQHLWCDASFATVLNPGGRSRAIEFVALDGHFFRLEEEEPLRLDRPAMVLSSWASRANYGHWLANTLLAVYLALDRLRAGELALISPPLSPRQREELLTLGAPESALIETSRSFVRGPLAYPCALSTATNMSPGGWVAEFFPFLRERLGAAPDAAGPRFVYLSRRRLAGSSRVMTNEGALIRRLAELGFACVDPQELDLAAQARLMARAEIVVGQFGAALWNLGFAPPGGVAIEIAVDAYASNEYLYLSQLVGLRFIRVMATADVAAAAAARGSSFSFEAPVEEIVAIARGLMAGR
jgi:capsular polysaccharide biosynthesis protein